MLTAGMKIAVDATRNGWVRTRDDLTPFGGGTPRRGWGLISGEKLGLGVLLRPDSS